MPLYSEHISNMYFGGSPSYSGSPYSYSGTVSPLGSSYSASYLNPGGNYSNHSSLAGYSRPHSSLPHISSRWISSAGRSYSPMLSSISERSTGSPVRISSPRRIPITKRSYGTSGYIPRPININTADIDVSKDRYCHKFVSTPIISPKSSPKKDNENESKGQVPLTPQVDGKPETGIDTSPGIQRSTIKRGRTVVRLHTIKRRERDSPRKPQDENKTDASNDPQPSTSKPTEKMDEDSTEIIGWREKLSDDLVYKGKKEKKSLGTKLVEKHIIKDDDIDSPLRDSAKRKEIKQDLSPAPVPNIDYHVNKSPDRRCSMELLAEQASVLDSLIRKENLSTTCLDLRKVGDDDEKRKDETVQRFSRSHSNLENTLKTTKSDHSLHNSLNSLKDTRPISKRRSLKKSSSGGSICRLDSIVEFPKEIINLSCIDESRQLIKKEVIKCKPKLKPKITSSVEVLPPTSPLKFKVENVTVEEKPRIPKKEIIYSTFIGESTTENMPENDKELTRSSKTRKSIRKKLKNTGSIKDDAISPEPDDGNFWDKIGKRETVYLIKRKQNIDEAKEQNKRALFWFPEEEEMSNGEKNIGIHNSYLQQDRDISVMNYEIMKTDSEHETKNLEKVNKITALNVENPSESIRVDIDSNVGTSNNKVNDILCVEQTKSVHTDSSINSEDQTSNIFRAGEKSESQLCVKIECDTSSDKAVDGAKMEKCNKQSKVGECSNCKTDVTLENDHKSCEKNIDSKETDDTLSVMEKVNQKTDKENIFETKKGKNTTVSKASDVCNKKMEHVKQNEIQETAIPSSSLDGFQMEVMEAGDKKITKKGETTTESSDVSSKQTKSIKQNENKKIVSPSQSLDKSNGKITKESGNSLPEIKTMNPAISNKKSLSNKDKNYSKGENKLDSNKIKSEKENKNMNNVKCDAKNTIQTKLPISDIKTGAKEKTNEDQNIDQIKKDIAVVLNTPTPSTYEVTDKTSSSIEFEKSENAVLITEGISGSELTNTAALDKEDKLKEISNTENIPSQDTKNTPEISVQLNVVGEDKKAENISKEEVQKEGNKLSPEGVVRLPQTPSPRRPVKDEPALRPLIATPRPLQKKAPQIIHSSSSSESSSEEESTDDEDDDESDASEGSAEFYECENNTDGRTSTGSNDSGFDSSAPTSPAGFLQIKKGGGSPGASTSTAHAHSDATDISEQELEQSTAYGLFRKTGRFTPPARSIPRFRKYAIDDFHFIKVLGKGSFGKVLLAELRDTEYYYAVKCLKKDVVLEDDDVECTLIERKVLALGTNHPYLCHLFATFQTDSHLFFVMEYLNGGDLMFHIQQSGRFPESRARFYAAEIVSGLKFLHKRGIVYRDLKLDNILLDFDGHVRIADFGMCKLQIYLEKTADTFCGTPDYMAPEIIKGLKYNQTVDWWSFGVLLYEMLIGQSPFSGCDEDELFWSICNEIPSYPRFLSQDSLTILTRLLDKDARTRLGGVECMHGDVRDQEFFRNVHWDRLERRELDAPFKPRVRHPLDTQYFDRAFTGERPRLTAVEPQVLRSMDQEAFRGFSYTNPNATDR